MHSVRWSSLRDVRERRPGVTTHSLLQPPQRQPRYIPFRPSATSDLTSSLKVALSPSKMSVYSILRRVGCALAVDLPPIHWKLPSHTPLSVRAYYGLLYRSSSLGRTAFTCEFVRIIFSYQSNIKCILPLSKSHIETTLRR
jgi:hypothetical protein